MGLFDNLFSRTLEVEFVTYEPETRGLLFACATEAELGEYSCKAKIEDHKLKCRIRIESKEAGLYYGTFLAPEEAAAHLAVLLPQPKKFEDQRGAERVERHLRVSSPGIPNYQAISQDLSLTGVKLRTDHPMEVGSQFECQIEFDDSSMSRLNVTCEVRWSRPYQGKALVGAQFLDLMPGTRARLAYFIKALTEVERGVLKGSYTIFD